jgi:hypothetical protein
MIDGRSRAACRAAQPTVQDAAADIQRLTTALKLRRQVAPDNLVELAALAADLKRASAVWRKLVPTSIWDGL